MASRPQGRPTQRRRWWPRDERPRPRAPAAVTAKPAHAMPPACRHAIPSHLCGPTRPSGGLPGRLPTPETAVSTGVAAVSTESAAALATSEQPRLQPPVAATATSTAASPAVAAAGRAAAPPPHPPTANPSLIPTCPCPADDPAARALAAALWSVDRSLGWAATAAAVTAVVATMAGLAADPRAAAIAAAAAGGGGGGGGTPALGADTPRWGGGGRRPTPPPRPGVVGGGSGGGNRGSSRGRRTPANHTIGSHGHRRCCRRHRPRRR